MPHQPNIALALEGTLWGTPVKLQYIHTDDFDHGRLSIGSEGDQLDLSEKIESLVGKGFELKLPGHLDIHFFNKHIGKQSARALGATYGGLDFQYSWGPKDEAKGFFVQLQLDDLLKKLPGIPESAVSGHVFVGYVMKDQVYHFAQNEHGTWQAAQTSPGLAFGGVLEIGGHRFSPQSLNESKPLPATQPESSEVKENTELQELSQGDQGQLKWMDLGSRKAGPITLHGLGFKQVKGTVTILVRAEMTFGGLSLALLGVGVDVTLSELTKSPLKAFKFKMQGLGLSYQSKGFTIAGFFEKPDPDKEEYSGGILLKTKAFAITGIGAYAQEEGYKSIFGYLSVDVNLGGPPSFFVLGLVACFGYNRQLLIPSIDKLNEFPLVRYAIDSSTAPDFGKGNPIVQFNQKLAPYIPPKRDHMFFGIGVKFSTYKVVTTVAMLTVAKGDDLEFNLLGISRLILPPGTNGVVIVFVELALRGAYSVDKGLLQIEGRLSNQSYIFSQSVKLTGGFAFYAWFKDNNEQGIKGGDFVITVGGYHPDFKPPAHYPVVPRLGFEWKVGENLTLSGKMYLALTPVAIMAGGAFEAIFKAGPLKAEFRLDVHFLISWKPFFYDARLRVSIHVSYHIDTWLVKRTVSLDLNVKLHVWGPDFSGRALLEFRVCRIGFSIPMEFGNAPKKPKELSWKDFKSGFLSSELQPDAPKEGEQSKLLSIVARNGLIEEQIRDDASKQAEEEGKLKERIWVVNPKELSIAIESVIPVTRILVYAKEGADVKFDKEGGYCIPLVKAEKVTSALKITFQSWKKGEWETMNAKLLTGFSYKPVDKNLPRSIWNDEVDTSKQKQLSTDTSIPMAVGLLLSPGNQEDKRIPYQISEEAFRLKSDSGDKPVMPKEISVVSTEEVKDSSASFSQFLIMDREQYPDENFISSPLAYVLDDSTASLTDQMD